MTVAESAGPFVAGSPVRLLSASVAVLVDVITVAVSAVVLATARVEETVPPQRRPGRHLQRDRPRRRRQCPAKAADEVVPLGGAGGAGGTGGPPDQGNVERLHSPGAQNTLSSGSAQTQWTG